MSQVGIYGAGGYGRAFCRAMQAKGVEVDFFIDQFSSASTVMDRPVFRPPDVPDKGATVYISLALNPVDGDPSTQIEAGLRASGLGDVRSFEQGLRDFPATLAEIFTLDQLWMGGTVRDRVDPDGIARLRELMSDGKSRELLERIVRFRQEPLPENYVGPDGQVEYFPDDIDVFAGIDRLRFVDCGAYTGDTVAELSRQLAARGRSADYVCSFEPDPENYGRSPRLRTPTSWPCHWAPGHPTPC